jgi:hypothetical protein
MIRPLARPYAYIGWLVTVAAGIAAIVIRVADPVPVVPNNLSFGDAALVGFVFLGLNFASIGGLLVIRRPANAVGWWMVLIGASYALADLSGALLYRAVASDSVEAAPAQLAAWFTSLFVMVGVLIFVLGLIFPTGRGHTPAWDRVNVIVGIVVIGYVMFVLFQPGSLQLFPSVENPFGFGPDIRSSFGARGREAITASGVILIPLIIWSLASRYRMSDHIGRQQLKWFILAALVATGAFALTAVLALITDRPPEAGLAVFAFAGAFVPLAIGVAILRYHLYAIDRLISRTIAYSIVIAALVVIYAGSIFVLTALLPFTGDDTIPIAASTLAVFAVFQPIMRRVRRSVDRRFDRARYDAERMAAAFAERLRDETDMETVTNDLARTARGAVAPVALGVWVRPRGEPR